MCELFSECCVAVDKNQAKHWLEKAEALFPYHPSIFKLKQRITALDDRVNVDTLESIIIGKFNRFVFSL